MLLSLRLTRPLAAKHLRACSLSSKPKRPAASLGVVRLDYNYPPAPGDIDSPLSYAYPVFCEIPLEPGTWDDRLIPDPVFAPCSVSPRCPGPRVCYLPERRPEDGDSPAGRCHEGLRGCDQVSRPGQERVWQYAPRASNTLG